MRGLLVVLAVSLLSGCLSQPSRDASAPAESPSTETPALRHGVELFNKPYQAAYGQSASFNVNVPDGAVNVLFKVGTKVTGPPMGATVTLEGCGAGTVTWSSIGIAGGNNWQGGPLCSSPESGSHQLTVEAAGLPLAGDIVVIADIP